MFRAIKRLFIWMGLMAEKATETDAINQAQFRAAILGADTEMEFAILDNGLHVEDGRVKYQWFMLAEPSGRSFFRAVALRELTYLPIETRDDPDMLGKQWAALRGLYNAGADFLYTALGAFRPDRLGVVQFYGAAAEAVTETSAATEALHRMAAVEATLANFPQSRTAAPDLARVDLLMARLRRLPRLLAILGHPDPRMARRGLPTIRRHVFENCNQLHPGSHVLLQGLRAVLAAIAARLRPGIGILAGNKRVAFR